MSTEKMQGAEWYTLRNALEAKVALACFNDEPRNQGGYITPRARRTAIAVLKELEERGYVPGLQTAVTLTGDEMNALLDLENERGELGQDEGEGS